MNGGVVLGGILLDGVALLGLDGNLAIVLCLGNLSAGSTASPAPADCDINVSTNAFRPAWPRV
jgi:hypothetical protein